MKNDRFDTVVGWLMVGIFTLTAIAAIFSAIAFDATHQYGTAGVALIVSYAQVHELRKEKREHKQMVQRESYKRNKTWE